MFASGGQGLTDDSFYVSISQLCRWVDVPRRTIYYQFRNAPPAVKPELSEPIKPLIEVEPSFGYRTVPGVFDIHKNTVLRIFLLMGWLVRKRAIGHRPRIKEPPSVATRPDQRGATGLCRVSGGRDGWLTLALYLVLGKLTVATQSSWPSADCCSCFRGSRSGRASPEPRFRPGVFPWVAC